MTNHHQQDQNQDQEPMVPMEYSPKNPNLDTTLNHNHVPPSPSSSSQDLHHQQHTHIPNQTHEDKGFIFKHANNNNQVMIKNPNFLSSFSSSSSSSSSTTLAAGEGYTMPPPPPPQHIKKTHHQNNIHVSKKLNENEGDFTIKNSLSCSSPDDADGEEVEESGRDKLKRHRVEMAGRVRIPDIWGHEDLLKDWIDCTVFDSSLGNNSIMSARAALVQERRSTLRIQN
ncbi:putative protein BIC [Helianthus anomalus]